MTDDHPWRRARSCFRRRDEFLAAAKSCTAEPTHTREVKTS
jgi:hypothetical protein